MAVEWGWGGGGADGGGGGGGEGGGGVDGEVGVGGRRGRQRVGWVFFSEEIFVSGQGPLCASRFAGAVLILAGGGCSAHTCHQHRGPFFVAGLAFFVH